MMPKEIPFQKKELKVLNSKHDKVATTERRGRKLKLNAEIIKRLAELLKAGNYIITSCNSLGFSDKSYYGWLVEAERIKGEYEANPQKKLTKRDKLFLEFSDTVKKADAEAEIRNVEIVQEAAQISWQAAMTLLERRHPSRWGRKDKVQSEHSGEVRIREVKITEQERED